MVLYWNHLWRHHLSQKNVNISKTKKDILKRNTPFFYTLKGLLNKQQLFFYLIGTLSSREVEKILNLTRISVWERNILIAGVVISCSWEASCLGASWPVTHKITFVQANLLTEQNQTQSIGFRWIEFRYRSLSSASFGRWEKDPGCGWSRDYPWHFSTVVESTKYFCRSSLVIAILNHTQAIHLWSFPDLF